MALSDEAKSALGIATKVVEAVSEADPRLKSIPTETIIHFIVQIIEPYLTDNVKIAEGSMEIGEGVEVDVVD